MVRLAYLTGCIVLVLAAPATGADRDGTAACRVMAPIEGSCARSWASGNQFIIRGTTSSERKTVEWHYEFAANRDLKLDIHINSDTSTRSGALLLIDKSTMLTHGLPETRGRAFDTLSVPVLALQLVVDLLERAAPGGPDALRGGRVVAIADNRQPLIISAGNASGMVPSPWKLSGTIRRGANSAVEFDLALTFTTMLDGAQAEKMHIAGVWDKRPNAPLLPDSTKIAGWAIHRIDGYSDVESGRTLSGFRTTPVSDAFDTLGALRRHISGEYSDEAR